MTETKFVNLRMSKHLTFTLNEPKLEVECPPPSRKTVKGRLWSETDDWESEEKVGKSSNLILRCLTNPTTNTLVYPRTLNLLHSP